jgi:hypothetical protein
MDQVGRMRFRQRLARLTQQLDDPAERNGHHTTARHRTEDEGDEQKSDRSMSA